MEDTRGLMMKGGASFMMIKMWCITTKYYI